MAACSKYLCSDFGLQNEGFNDHSYVLAQVHVCVRLHSKRPVLIFQKLQAVEHYQYHRHLCPYPGFAICLERDFLGYIIYFSFQKKSTLVYASSNRGTKHKYIKFPLSTAYSCSGWELLESIPSIPAVIVCGAGVSLTGLMARRRASTHTQCK